MMQTNNAKALSTSALGLPETAITKAGFLFYPQENMWRIADQSRRQYFNFTELSHTFDAEFIKALKKVLYYYLTQKSASLTSNIFKNFKHLVRTVIQANDGQLSSIKSVHIIDYKGKLPRHQEYFMGVLSGFFIKWYELGYPGIEPEVISLLDQLTIKGNRKGDAVRTMDPREGPFTDIELQGIHEALNNSYAKGELGMRAYILAWLYIALGSRSIQIASLKISDFSVQRANNAASYLIRVPRAKQRGTDIRDEFKTRPLISEIGEVLETWIEQVKFEYTQSISDGLLPGNLPIFPSRNSLNPIGFEHHSTGQQLGYELEEVFAGLSVTSERTGLPIKANPRRFRYTLGTRAAMEGHGELIIADLLDHTDTQQVGVYVEATPEIIDRIDRAMALQLAPLAQAFSGMVIIHEWEAERGDDPTSRIRGANIEVVGNCGKYGFCAALAPIVCYTCRSFQAWVDGPHEKVLENLISERERLLEETGDYRIAAVNDRTILAVAQVVQQCIKLREQGEVL